MLLEQAKRRAVGLLAIGLRHVDLRDPDVSKAVGIGYAVAKGWATYQGDGEFRVTEAGLKAMREELSE